MRLLLAVIALAFLGFVAAQNPMVKTGPGTFRMTDFKGQMGEVYGSLTREFYVGLPDRQRPWVIVLYFGDGSTQIVFTSNR